MTSVIDGATNIRLACFFEQKNDSSGYDGIFFVDREVQDTRNSTIVTKRTEEHVCWSQR